MAQLHGRMKSTITDPEVLHPQRKAKGGEKKKDMPVQKLPLKSSQILTKLG